MMDARASNKRKHENVVNSGKKKNKKNKSNKNIKENIQQEQSKTEAKKIKLESNDGRSKTDDGLPHTKNTKEVQTKKEVVSKEKNEKISTNAEDVEEEHETEEEEHKGGAHKNVPDNLLLFQYYQDIIKDKEEFAKFKQSLHTRLQTTFRIGGDDVISETFLFRMRNSGSFLELAKGVKVGGESIPPPAPIAWYPGNKAWKYSVSGEYLRRSEIFSKVHDFLVAASNSGDIWRQEEASMIPPCFLDAQPTHKILDMCAAPGSKTAQIHDMVFGKRSNEIPSGCVIANDANHKRCLLLAQRLTKTSSPHILVTNHDAQHFPLKTGGMRLRFDRILCDVPCSGDGTLRKLPSKAWAGWSPASAFSLHSLQTAIVQRGLELLGINGKLVYSTCSMNPIENEAVVSTILQKFKGQVELVDVSNQVPGLKRHKGLQTWRVMDADGKWYSTYKEVPKELHDTILPTMFPKKSMDLSRCVRIFPHTQDTSGFFVSVFKVIKLIDVEQHTEVKPNIQKGKNRSPPPRFTSIWGDQPTNNHPDLVNAISSVYQIRQDFPWRACFARKTEISEKKIRNVLLFSDSLRDILQHNKKDVINVVNGGVPLFERTNKDFTNHNNFKLLPPSLPFLSPFLGPKRLITLSHPDDLSLLISSQRLPFSFLHDLTTLQALQKLFVGYVVVKFSLDTGENEPKEKEEEGKGKGKGKVEKKEEEKVDKKEEGMVVCRNGNGSLSLCASSSEVWSLKFLLNYT